MSNASIALSFLGSFGLFIFGMSILAAGLKKAMSSKMRTILASLSDSRLKGILLGAGVTALIQSSTATTVMVVGFVNAGIMNISQVVGIIMGANIGTTTTSWLVASVEWAYFLRPAVIGQAATAFGALMLLFTTSKKYRNIGEIIVGFGLLFMGLTMMPDAVRPLRELEGFRQMFVVMGANPILGILAGFLVTAIIQSSTASVGILQSLAYVGMVPWSAAVFIILGQNVGTCLTAVLSSLGANKNARAAAYIHLTYNLFAAVIFGIAAFIYFTFVNRALGTVQISSTYVSLFHTVYNVASVIILLPLAGFLVKISSKMAGVSKVDSDSGEAVHLDDRVLGTPAFALESSVKEILRLAYMTYDNVSLATKLFFEKSGKNSGTTEDVYTQEGSIDKLEMAITDYLVKVSGEDLNMEETAAVMSLFHTLTDIERIADHAENIAELADALHEEELSHSEAAAEELKFVTRTALSCYQNAITAFETGDKTAAAICIKEEAIVDEMERKYRREHISRLALEEYNLRSGVLFMEMLNNLERITDHSRNIAESILGVSSVAYRPAGSAK